jgi:hypothetical protein
MGEGSVTLLCDGPVMPPPGTGASAEDYWWAGSRAQMTMRRAFRFPDVTPSAHALPPCGLTGRRAADEYLECELADLSLQWAVFSTANSLWSTLVPSDRLDLAQAIGGCYVEVSERWSESILRTLPQIIELFGLRPVPDHEPQRREPVAEAREKRVPVDPTRIFRESRVPTPLEAADAVKAFFNLRLDELTRVTGVKRTTYLDWRRNQRTPRPSSVQRLMDVYGLTYSLVRGMGAQDATIWFRSGSPTPLDMLADGDAKAVERLARRALPSAVPERGSIGAFVAED